MQFFHVCLRVRAIFGERAKYQPAALCSVSTYSQLIVFKLEIAVHLAVACDVYDGVFLCCPFSHEMSWMRS